MTTMGDPESPELAGAQDDDSGASPSAAQTRRPSMSKRRTSSSSTMTVVSRPSHERRTSSGRRSRSNSGAHAGLAQQVEQQPSTSEVDTITGETQPPASAVNGSVTSSSGDWESATDSPVKIGQKLPDTAEEFQPEEQSALARALDAQPEQDEADQQPQQQPQAGGRAGGRKAKFQLGASDPFEDDDEEDDAPDAPEQKFAHQAGTQPAVPPDAQEGQVEAAMGEEIPDVVPQAQEGSIPDAAMPPAATAALPALPATIHAAAPPTPEQGEAKLSPEDEQEAAAVAAPPPTSAAQHLSPPEIPQDEDSSTKKKSHSSLLAAAQPELAFPNKPPSNPPSQNSTRPSSPIPNPATPPDGPTDPLSPNPTSVQREKEQEEQKAGAKRSSPLKREAKITDDRKSSEADAKPGLPRQKPARKASDASIMSTMSRRSYFDRPAPQFRRTASGVAPPSIDRDVTARGDFSGPASDESRRGGDRRSGHGRGDSINSMRSLRQNSDGAALAPPQSRHGNSLAPAEPRRSRSSESSSSGALAALGNIAASAGRSATSPAPEPGLSAAKRSASGYFNALRGFTTLPSTSSTPPLSPAATQTQRYPIPGPSSSSYTRSSAATRPRPSPSPRQPPLVVKFVEPPQPKLPPPTPSERSTQDQRASSPAALRGNLSAQHRNSSSASLGPMSRTQQKALLARDAPQYAGGEGGGALVPPSIPGGLTPAQQQFLALQQQRAAAAAAASAGPSSAAGSSPASPAPGAQGVNQGMQKWAFGLVREAERIERQYRAVEKWRDPLGESLERVLIVRQRARRRREDDREKVRQAIAAAAAARQQQAAATSTGGKSHAGTPISRRSSAGGTSETDSRPPSMRGKQRSECQEPVRVCP